MLRRAVIAIVMLVVLVCVCLLPACASRGPFVEKKRVASQDLAGSTHVAVLSVAPWEKYRDALQPAFRLTSDEAFMLAVPDTMAMQDKLLDAVSAQLRFFSVEQGGDAGRGGSAGGGGRGGSSASAARGAAQPARSGGAQSSRAGGSGAGAGSSGGSGAAPEGAPPAEPMEFQERPDRSMGGALGTDPLLRFWVATALFQEVQMLDRYVRDAAVGVDYYPYLLRLQVSLMPSRRDLPYDAYTTIGVFLGEFDRGENVKQAASTQPAAKFASTPRIVPLLVTDNLESAIESRSADRLRKFALAVSSIAHSYSGGASIQTTQEELQTAMGRELNSTFTVGRVSDNSIRLRFGASFQAESKYAMIPQTHNVSLLVLVPKWFIDRQGPPRLHFASRTVYVDAEDGTGLPPRSPEQFAADLRGVLARYGLTNLSPAEATALLELVELNDSAGFASAVGEKAKYVEALWLELLSLRTMSQWASTRVELPRRFPAAVLNGQTVALFDDLRGTTVAAVRCLGDLAATDLGASLTLRRTPGRGGAAREPEAVAGGEATLLSTATAISADGGSAIFTFPSLHALGAADKAMSLGQSVPTLQVQKVSAESVSPLGNPLTCVYVPRVAPEPPFNIFCRAKAIVAGADGTGHVQVVFSEIAPDADIVLNIDGADIKKQAHAGEAVSFDATGAMHITRSGAVTIDLENLNPLSNVVFLARDERTRIAARPIVLFVSERSTPARGGRGATIDQ